MTSPPGVNHLVEWDVQFNRPIVDGKIVNPFSGEIQEAGKEGFKKGPPFIEFSLINTNADTGLTMANKDFPVSLEKLYLGVAKCVQEGIYSLISINASRYSFVIVCAIQVSKESFFEACDSMYSHTDEEWRAYLQGKYIKPSINV